MDLLTCLRKSHLVIDVLGLPITHFTWFTFYSEYLNCPYGFAFFLMIYWTILNHLVLLCPGALNI